MYIIHMYQLVSFNITTHKSNAHDHAYIYFIEKQCFINANYLLLSHVIHFLQENTKTANNFLPLSKSGSIFITLSSDLQRQLLYLNANQCGKENSMEVVFFWTNHKSKASCDLNFYEVESVQIRMKFSPKAAQLVHVHINIKCSPILNLTYKTRSCRVLKNSTVQQKFSFGFMFFLNFCFC